MFTNEELEGCPNEMFVDWVQEHEEELMDILHTYIIFNNFTGQRTAILKLLMMGYDFKKCPYA